MVTWFELMVAGPPVRPLAALRHSARARAPGYRVSRGVCQDVGGPAVGTVGCQVLVPARDTGPGLVSRPGPDCQLFPGVIRRHAGSGHVQ
jgi:hypothetical protein